MIICTERSVSVSDSKLSELTSTACSVGARGGGAKGGGARGGEARGVEAKDVKGKGVETFLQVGSLLVAGDSTWMGMI